MLGRKAKVPSCRRETLSPDLLTWGVFLAWQLRFAAVQNVEREQVPNELWRSRRPATRILISEFRRSQSNGIDSDDIDFQVEWPSFALNTVSGAEPSRKTWSWSKRLTDNKMVTQLCCDSLLQRWGFKEFPIKLLLGEINDMRSNLSPPTF